MRTRNKKMSQSTPQSGNLDNFDKQTVSRMETMFTRFLETMSATFTTTMKNITDSLDAKFTARLEAHAADFYEINRKLDRNEKTITELKSENMELRRFLDQMQKELQAVKTENSTSKKISDMNDEETRVKSVQHSVPTGSSQTTMWSDMAMKLNSGTVFKKKLIGKDIKSAKLVAAPRKMRLFVGRLDNTMTEQDVVNHVKDSCGVDTTCKKLSAKDGRTFSFSAFILTCDSTDVSIVMDENIWPMGCEVREWVYKNQE